jgi:hypothetical protein
MFQDDKWLETTHDKIRHKFNVSDQELVSASTFILSTENKNSDVFTDNFCCCLLALQGEPVFDSALNFRPFQIILTKNVVERDYFFNIFPEIAEWRF